MTTPWAVPGGTGRTQPAAVPDATAQYTELVDQFHLALTTTQPTALRTRLQACCAPDIRYSNPWWAAAGIGQLAGSIGDTTARQPAHTITRLTDLDIHHGQALLTWVLRDPAGTAVLYGTEIVLFSEGPLIQQAIAFFGALRPLTRTYTYGSLGTASNDH